jgi:hypothetical protein
MKSKTKIMVSAAIIIATTSTTVIVPASRHGIRTVITTASAHLSPNTTAPFPDINTNALSKQQASIIAFAKNEYQKHPVSYDQTVLKYTQGNKEAWCADFISWIMQQSGASYKNPSSGSWRIPGVFTLQDYYKTQNRYETVSNYEPQPGDVAFYIGKHTSDLFSTEHAAIVIQVSGHEMTTLGGNEGGRLRLNTQRIKRGENSLVGFGKLKP